MEEAEQDRSASVESAAGDTKDAVKGSKAFRAEIADNASLVPRPSPFDRIEIRGVGREPNDGEPIRLSFGELAGGKASVRCDTVPDHDEEPGQVLVKLLEELDYAPRADRPGNQPKKEAGSATVWGVGRSPHRQELLPVAKADALGPGSVPAAPTCVGPRAVPIIHSRP